MAALAQVGDRLVQVQRRDAGGLQDLGALGAARHGQRQQQIFGGDEAVAGLLGDLLGIVEQLGRVGRQIDLARLALDLRQLGERALDPGPHLFRLAAGRRDQPRGQALFVIDEDLQKMFGGEVLVIGAQRQPLGGLHESARPLGEFLDVHLASKPSAPERF